MKHAVILPPPSQLKRLCSQTENQLNFIKTSRQKIVDILNGVDPRLLLIVGPCSIHDTAAAVDYAKKLKAFASQVEKDFLIVMRTYFEKPRTSTGWKGMLYDPNLDRSGDIAKGIQWSRELLLKLADLELPAATEFLDPLASSYYEDLISWGCVGARTTSSQPHREMASGLPMPVAFKNTTDGNVGVAVNAVLAADVRHSYMGMDDEGRVAAIYTRGNPHCHIVLRGSESETNYHPLDVASSLRLLEDAGLPPRLLIDCSHDNSRRCQKQQVEVFESVISQYIEGNTAIRGILLESNLNDGAQSLLSKPLSYGTSITDPCLDWESTQRLILWGSQKLKLMYGQCVNLSC